MNEKVNNPMQNHLNCNYHSLLNLSYDPDDNSVATNYHLKQNLLMLENNKFNAKNKNIDFLITNEDNDLSAVNMITLKKYHPDVPQHTHEVTKNIDLKELFHVVQSKQQTVTELIQHYNNLISFNDAKTCFISRKKEMPVLPMETALDMGNNTVFNVKDCTELDQASNKRYVDNSVNVKADKTYVDTKTSENDARITNNIHAINQNNQVFIALNTNKLNTNKLNFQKI